MGIRFTKATREILGFIDDYGFITAAICMRLFYKGKSNGYNQAQVKLRGLYNNKVLKRYKHPMTNEYLYQREIRVVSDHSKYVLDLYSIINSKVDEVLYFKLEERWNISNRINDGHIIFKNNGVKRGYLIEFEKYHTTSSKKIDEIFHSEEVHEWYKLRYKADYFPKILLITSSGHSKCKGEDWQSFCIDYTFSGIEELL